MGTFRTVGLYARSVRACSAATLVAASLTACGGASRPPMPGSDRDAHGCIPSAGYAWCARQSACVRPWELASAQGFANTPEAFAEFCAAK
ncbi:MAG: hypothetical protein NTU86_03665 [Burkholderiales bacterium]|nr:hypothetical protein [Burkholderiales bacterium]